MAARSTPHLVTTFQCLGDVGRALHGGDQDVSEAFRLLRSVTRGPCELRCSLEIDDCSRRRPAPEANHPRESERAGQTRLVVEFCEDADGAGELIADELVAGGLGLEQPEVRECNGGVSGDTVIVGRLPSLERLRENGLGAIPFARILEGAAESRKKGESLLVVSGIERGRTREEIGRRAHVAAGGGLTSCRGDSIGRAYRHVACRARLGPEFDAIAMRLLEVVADNFVEFDQVRGAAVDP
jgi:hypothetical protein